MTSVTVHPRTKPAMLAELRRRIQSLERPAAGSRAPVPLGLDPVDAALPRGGIERGALHEVAGGGSGRSRPGDAAIVDEAALGFAALLLARLTAGADGPALWCGQRQDLYAPGLAALGFDPGRLILAGTTGEKDALWAMEEGLRTPALAAVLGEVGRIGLTAARRLQLAAERSGVTALLLRPGLDETAPSAAVTRWRVRPAPSLPASDSGSGQADAPTWHVELLRCRGGTPGAWTVAWSGPGDMAAWAAASPGAAEMPSSVPAARRVG